MSGPVDFLRRIVVAGLDHTNAALVADPQTLGRTVFIDTTGFSPVDFNIDTAAAEALYQRGVEAATRFLAGFSFDRYSQLAVVQRAPLTLLEGAQPA